MASPPRGSKAPQASRSRRVAVVGAGVIGLSCALELRARGADVIVYEKSTELGGGATSRSAGMLGAAFEWGLEQDQLALAAMAHHAGELWPDFAARIERLAEGKIERSDEGALVVARNDAEMAWLDQLAAACQARELPVRRLSAAMVGDVEGALRGGVNAGVVRGALLLPEDRQVDAVLLLQRMAAAVKRLGVGVRMGRAVERVVVGREIAMPDGEKVDAVVLATGAGALPRLHGMRGEVLDAGVGAVVPVKGQMLALAPVAGAPRHVVHARDVYIAPKARWVLVGATLERGVDDVVVNREAVAQLRARAAELVGALRDAPEVSAWAGVRPGTVDDAPMIGESAVQGVHVALGMYRNGVLLAPAVGEAVAASVLDAAPRPPFNPLRFSDTGV